MESHRNLSHECQAQDWRPSLCCIHTRQKSTILYYPTWMVFVPSAYIVTDVLNCYHTGSTPGINQPNPERGQPNQQMVRLPLASKWQHPEHMALGVF